ncbi:hypothetical protein K7711_37720 [Nocardia sp. CA2R105]|uniref:hypothetical protein n=1 Tax=Nocardia coffeae TaxID=2873381 RepID=UPI001CA65B36|nr:hypothetical protein [Nocardia coffeae]MBY8862262.1 hypothetical protein [Nocardia coffeae]
MGEVDDWLVFCRECCGVFDDAVFVAGCESEFGQDLWVDDERGHYGLTVGGVDAYLVFVIDDVFDADLLGYRVTPSRLLQCW